MLYGLPNAIGPVAAPLATLMMRPIPRAMQWSYLLFAAAGAVVVIVVVVGRIRAHA